MTKELIYLFLCFVSFFIYGIYMDEDFMAGAAFSPMLIMAGVWLNERIVG